MSDGFENCTSRFPLEGTDHGEFLVALMSHFPQTTHVDSGKVHLFSSQDGREPDLEVHLTKEKRGKQRRILKILVRARARGLLGGVVESVTSALQSDGTTVGRETMLGWQPVAGAFRSEAAGVQILPISDLGSEIPGWIEHPFLLEFRFPTSTDVNLKNYRRERRATQIFLLLNLALKGTVRRRKSERRLAWAVPHGEHGSAERSIPVVLGYRQSGMSFEPGAFVDIEGLAPIEEVPEEEFYRRPPGINMGKPLFLPAGLEMVFLAFDSLGPEDANRFLQACYWFSVATDRYQASRSVAYQALVQAVEALLPDPPREACETCQQPLQSVSLTRQFEEFLTAHTSSSQPWVAEGIKKLYERRSQVAHGGVFQADLGASAFWVPQGLGEEEDDWLARRLVSIALLNWLRKGMGR